MRKAKFWFKNEKEVMRSLGFEPVKGSGSGWIHKEDGESEFALAQLKSTEAESYKLSYLDVQKLEYHASVSHKVPMFIIEFLNRGTYVLVNANDFSKLKNICFGLEEKIKESSVVDVDDVQERKSIGSSKTDREKFYKERENKWKNRKRK